MQARPLGPDSMWKALKWSALRIGHGIAAIQDESLIKELVTQKLRWKSV